MMGDMPGPMQQPMMGGGGPDFHHMSGGPPPQPGFPHPPMEDMPMEMGQQMMSPPYNSGSNFQGFFDGNM